jgi:tetratricopeptide (TPR) repeat protein
MRPRLYWVFLLLFISAPMFCQLSAPVETTLFQISALERSGAYEHAIILSRTILQSSDLDPGQRGEALNVLGLSEDDEGNVSQSLQAYKEALQALVSVEGTDRIRAATLNDLGRLYRETNQLPLSFKLRLQALQLYKRANDHAGQAIVDNNLSALALSQGYLSEGDHYLKAAEHEASVAKDLDALDRASIISTRAWSDALKGAFASAVAADTQAVYIASRAYGRLNPTVGWLEVVLASAHDLNGQHDQAMRLCQQGLSSLRRSTGSGGARYLSAELSCSEILDHAGAHEEASRLSREAEQAKRTPHATIYAQQAIGLVSAGAR